VVSVYLPLSTSAAALTHSMTRCYFPCVQMDAARFMSSSEMCESPERPTHSVAMPAHLFGRARAPAPLPPALVPPPPFGTRRASGPALCCLTQPLPGDDVAGAAGAPRASRTGGRDRETERGMKG